MSKTSSWTMTTLAVIVVVLGMMWGCDRTAASEQGSALVLRSFEVDPDLAGELEIILNEALARGENEAPVGRVSVGPGGRLIVAAPAAVLDAVEVLITDVEAASPPPPPVISMTYWVVRGTPAAETSWPERLGEVAQALEGICAAEGTTRFIIEEKVQLRSLSGERANSMAREYRVTQRATERDGRVLVSVTLQNTRRASGSIETRLQLAPGQLLVLGQTGVGGVEASDEQASVYFIVRAGVEGSSVG
jgi:hypothetical protein